MSLKFHVYLGLLSCLICGCSHAPKTAPARIECAALIGDFFEPVDQTNAPDFRLEANGRYSEIDFLIKTPVKDRSGRIVAVGVDGMGPVDRGTWIYTNGTLVLVDKNSHKIRRYSAADIDGVIVLTLQGDISTRYQKAKPAAGHE